MCVHGSAGSRLTGSTAAVPVKMSFGPWPMKCLAIGAPTNAIRIRKMMKTPLARRALSGLPPRPAGPHTPRGGERDLVAPQPPPDELPIAARAYRFGIAELRTALDPDRSAEAGTAGDEDLLFLLSNVREPLRLTGL